MNTPANPSAAASLDLGPLEPLLQDPAITEIMVNGPETIYVERNGTIEETSSRFHDETHLLAMIQRLAASMGQQVNESNPFVDMHLPDGSRVNVIIPPISLIGPVLTIRKFIQKYAPVTIEDLLR
ncbi:MAG: CpaF family protein, partial [Chloroflexi bacterium]|nr:CpaF family protein [Chloroflexota bacterium]